MNVKQPKDQFPMVLPSASTEVQLAYQNILDGHFKDVFVVNRVDAMSTWEEEKFWSVYFTTKDETSEFYPSFSSPTKSTDFAFEIESDIISHKGYHITYSISQNLGDPFWVCNFRVADRKVIPLPENKPISYKLNKRPSVSTKQSKSRKVKSNNLENTVVESLLKQFTALCCVLTDKSKTTDSHLTREESSQEFCKKPRVIYSDERKQRFHNSFFARLRIKRKLDKLKNSKTIDKTDYTSVPPPDLRIKYLLKYFDQVNLRHILAVRLLSSETLSRQEYFWATNVIMQIGIHINTADAAKLYLELLDKFHITDEQIKLLCPDMKTVGVSVIEGARPLK